MPKFVFAAVKDGAVLMKAIEAANEEDADELARMITADWLEVDAPVDEADLGGFALASIDDLLAEFRKWTVVAFTDGDYGVHPMVLRVEAKTRGEAWDAAVEKARETMVGTVPEHGGGTLHEADLDGLTEIATFEGWLD